MHLYLQNFHYWGIFYVTWLINIHAYVCKIGLKKKKKKRNTYFNFSTNRRREIKLLPIHTEYFLLKIYALKIVLGVRLYGVLYLNLIFPMQIPKFNNGIFTMFLTLTWELWDLGIINNASFNKKVFSLNINGIDKINTFVIHTNDI